MTEVPSVGSLWRHYNGNVYRVFAITNAHTERPDTYPITVCYAGENGRQWSRPLDRWRASMTEISPE